MQLTWYYYKLISVLKYIAESTFGTYQIPHQLNWKRYLDCAPSFWLSDLARNKAADIAAWQLFLDIRRDYFVISSVFLLLRKQHDFDCDAKQAPDVLLLLVATTIFSWVSSPKIPRNGMPSFYRSGWQPVELNSVLRASFKNWACHLTQLYGDIFAYTSRFILFSLVCVTIIFLILFPFIISLS
jgi:hypothetical protein